MPKKLFGLNLDIDLKSRLDTMAKAKYTNSSHLVNQIIAKEVDEFEGKVKERAIIMEEAHISPEEIEKFRQEKLEEIDRKHKESHPEVAISDDEAF